MKNEKKHFAMQGKKGYRVGNVTKVFYDESNRRWRREIRHFYQTIYRAIIVERYYTLNGQWKNPAYRVLIEEGPFQGKEISVQ